MDEHQKWKVSAAVFARAPRPYCARMTRRKHQLADALRGHDADKQNHCDAGRHAAAPFISTYSAEKPGPNAVTKARSPRAISPASKNRSSTNKHDGDDMLP